MNALWHPLDTPTPQNPHARRRCADCHDEHAIREMEQLADGYRYCAACYAERMQKAAEGRARLLTAVFAPGKDR